MPVEPVGRACRKRVRFFMVLCIGLGGFASAARLRKFCGRIGGIRADGLFGERGCPPSSAAAGIFRVFLAETAARTADSGSRSVKMAGDCQKTPFGTTFVR